MTHARTVRTSIGRDLLIQLLITEIVSIIFFTRIGGFIVAGIIAPFWGVVVPFGALLDWSRLPSAPQWFVAGCIALALVGVSAVAWLRFGSRLWAHVALALYGLWSMLLLLSVK